MAAVAKAKAKRSRKVHVQQLLFRRGGKRKGAGRKPKEARAGTTHEARPTIKAKHALHVVLRVVREVGNLRRPAIYQAVRQATIVAAMSERIRIIHLSIQATHIHLLIEAEDKRSLARGMQGFQISVARSVNTVLRDPQGRRRRGRVFADRYHLTVITTPRQARNVLSYVMNNWRKHQEDRTHGLGTSALVDRFSSGICFPDWQEREGHAWMWPVPDDYDPLIVYRPRSWLLREGWKRSGPISARAVPNQASKPRSHATQR